MPKGAGMHIAESETPKRSKPAGHPDLPKVFCIGFHKTGTTSLKMALMQLGYRVKGPIGRRESDVGAVVETRAREVVPKFDAFQDNPWPIIYRFLDKEYPGSKFVLSLRPTEKWMASVLDHFSGRAPKMREWIYGPGKGDPAGNEQTYIERYERHNREVLEYFKDRPDDLITFEISAGDGWEKLCAFLGHPVPQVPFPWANPKKTSEERAAIKKTRRRRAKRRIKESSSTTG